MQMLTLHNNDPTSSLSLTTWCDVGQEIKNAREKTLVDL